MKVAIVCDWLTNVGGAEKVLLAVHKMFPKAPIYTSKYDRRGIDWFNDADIRTGWLQIFPSKMRRLISPLRQFYFNHLDLSGYDLIISVTGAEAKSVKKGNAVHLCYCHVPTQYYWQMYDDYVKHPGFNKFIDPIISLGLKLFVKPLRKADYKAAQKPDQFITISSYAAEQIKKYYDRPAVIVAPPVEINKFNKKRDLSSDYGYINFSRQVSWKRHDLAIKACLKSKRRLTLIGDGPEHARLVELAKGSDLICFKNKMTTEELSAEVAKARGFIFPSMEPFGIAPVEALAAGCPAITYAEGGAKDFINDKNGVTFAKQTPESLIAALDEFENKKFDEKTVRESAQPFSEEEFRKKLQTIIDVNTLDRA